MGWEDQGRQEHGWFGNGTGGKDRQTGASGRGGVPGGLVARVQAVIYGAVAALPRGLRSHSTARPDAKTLERLTMVMIAWARGAGTDMARFAERFFGRGADDPVAGKLWASATLADRAGSHADLGVAATDLADAQQLVGLDRWPRFLADAGQRVDDAAKHAASYAPKLSGLPGSSPVESGSGPRGLLERLNPISTARAQGLAPAKVDLLSDELQGGHTLEKHVGKTQSYLDGRLSREVIPAASTYRNLDEATAVTQQVIDINRSQIAAWNANPTARSRTVITMSRPVTSSLYKPIGTVLGRGQTVPVPGNGATVVLQKNPGAPNGFTVLTSFPTFSGIPSED